MNQSRIARYRAYCLVCEIGSVGVVGACKIKIEGSISNLCDVFVKGADSDQVPAYQDLGLEP